MATYKVCYDAPRRIAFVLLASERTPFGSTMVGTFDHQGNVDALYDSEKQTALFDHAVEVLIANSINPFQTRVLVTVPRLIANVMAFSQPGTIGIDNEGKLYFEDELGVISPLSGNGVSIRGEQGIQGIQGIQGLSAYAVAVANGFIGTENDWLSSLVGPQGLTGKSAYQSALDNGFVGTEAAWLATLVGPQGLQGIPGNDGADGVSVPTGGTTGQILTKLSNTDYAFAWSDPPASGVSSFNTRTGAITLTSGDVTTALGYTPANLDPGTNLTIQGTATAETLTIGGTAQTGAITIGRSTSAQTINIGTGAQAAGNKVINIGTAGVSGSTTFISLGTSGGGAGNVTTNLSLMALHTNNYIGPNTGTADCNLYLRHTNAYVTIRFQGSGTTYGTIQSGTGQTWFSFNRQIFRSGDGATEYMRINETTGNVSIGNTNNSFKLDVSGNIRTPDSFIGNDTNGWGRFLTSGGALYIQAGSLNSGSAVAQDIVFTNMYGAGERLRIGGSGSITSANLPDAVGYKGLPSIYPPAAYTLGLSDMGKSICASGNITIPPNATTAFPAGTTIVVVNVTAGSTNITISSTDSVYLAGNAGLGAGTRTLAPFGIATLYKVNATSWIVSGAGVS